MATQTTHYHLIKPESANRVAVGDINDNSDTIDGYLYQANERADQIADDYNTSSTYNIGDYCRRENYIYKCNSNSVTGNWDSTKWDRVKVMDAVKTTEDGVDNAFKTMNVLGGKNLVIQPYTYGGGTILQVTVTINDDYSISLNGTAGNNFWIALNGALNSQFTLTLKKGEYRLSCSGFTSGLNQATFLGLIKAGETTPFATVNGGNDTREFSLAEDTNVFVGIRINSGEVLSHTLYPMLCFASVKDNEYAPFSLPNKVITERIQCNQTTAGTYTLQATVASNGAVTYEWVSTT